MNNTYKSDKKVTILAILLFVITVAVIISGVEYDKKRDAKNEKAIAAYQKKELGQAKEKNSTGKVKESKDVKTIGKGKSIKYLSIGDSVTLGYGASSQDSFFTNRLGTLITNNMGFQVQKNNIAKRGELLSEALNDVSQINSWSPDLITIEYGTNDSNTENNVSPAVFENELNTLLDGITTKVNRKPTIVLMTTWNVSYGQRYDDIITNIGKQRNIPVVNMKDIYSNKTNVCTAGNKTFYGVSDDFSPNDKGMEAIANVLYQKVQPLLYEKASK
ncbi:MULTISPECIES: SGNH/GDSL hydrolase family protein [Clostridium]|uniref:SGNH/GDSL hydrolase family protein n=1 Tax=Clostridium TaxID=1485 RepID=UPI000824F124|nr:MULTISPECIES: SGNH/GDSL hydrolase family protein [Clostridium]PJI09499.1 SGNH/GDSL hydrolase family protein [Clostridium sp. CT7]